MVELAELSFGVASDRARSFILSPLVSIKLGSACIYIRSENFNIVTKLFIGQGDRLVAKLGSSCICIRSKNFIIVT